MHQGPAWKARRCFCDHIESPFCSPNLYVLARQTGHQAYGRFGLAGASSGRELERFFRNPAAASPEVGTEPFFRMLRRSQMSAMGNCVSTKRIDLL